MTLLNSINSPDDLKKIPETQLIQVCKELRDFIIDAVAANPGHFGASLGVVELTVALHYVYNTPYDKLIWDVGHQAYGHKILTGRREKFHTNRKFKGLSGFPNSFESEYDAFTVGHSSTSISAALGMAIAARQKGEIDRKIVAVIGDGSLTGGMAYEAMNNAGNQHPDMLIILNDNQIAIDKNVGALSEYLLDITTSKSWNRLRDEVWNMLGRIKRLGPNSQVFVQKIENALKTVLLRQSNLFESLNIRYFGPVDGHDVKHIVEVLRDLRNIPGVKLLHCLTKKGKGFRHAELHQTAWHATGAPFDKLTGEKIGLISTEPSPPRFQDVFGYTLLELAEKNENIVGITPAMPTGCSMNILMEKMPHRAFDVGIAEQHAVTFSAGLAAQGLIPFCNIYSSFIQRAYDQVIHDVALQKLNVVFCIDRGGLVGQDGATHHGVFDIAFFRCIPNLIIASPINEEDLRNLMFTAQLGKGPFVIRYPRGNGVLTNWQLPFREISIGKGKQLVEGEQIALLSFGPIGNSAIKASKILHENGISTAVYDMRFAKPLDEDLLHKIFKKFENVITLEDGTIAGGFGSSVIEFACENGYMATIKRIGVPDKFVEHGTVKELYHECGMDTEGIVKTAEKMMVKKNSLLISK